MFIAGGVLPAVIQTSLLQWWALGLRGFLCCNTASGHWKTLEARLSGSAVSSSYNTFMTSPYVTKPLAQANPHRGADKLHVLV